jgi:hypothetical protein
MFHSTFRAFAENLGIEHQPNSKLRATTMPFWRACSTGWGRANFVICNEEMTMILRA